MSKFEGVLSSIFMILLAAFAAAAMTWWVVEGVLLTECQKENNVYDCHMVAIPTEQEQPHD